MSLINPPNINNSGNGYYSKINKFLKLSKLNVKTSRVLLIIAIICVLFFITTHLFRTKQQQNIIDQEPITSTTTPLKSKNSSQKTQSTTGTNTLADSVAQQRTFTIWSTSFHISPIQCLSHFLQNSLSKKTGLKIKIINKSLSGHCHLQNSCARNLQVLNQDTAQKSLCNSRVGSDLFNAYRRDEEFSSVDLIMCDHNIAMCELYMPFDKPMVLYATTRYELWRHDVFSWKKLNQNLERISRKAHNSLIANNEFDANYVNYFTGLKVPVLDSFCAYPADEGTYQPIKKEFLVGPSRLNLPHHFFTKFNEAVAKDESRKENPVKIVGIRELYKNYKYSDLASHPAIVIVPYQLSVMSFFEYYRMNIPMYAPSVELITEWERDYDILKEKTWGHVLYGGKSTGSPKELSQHPKSTTKLGLDPNNEVDRETTMYWNGFADFYQWPNIIIYTSWEDLYQKLRDTPKEKYLEISEKMKQYNKKVENDLIEKWTDIIERALKHEKRNEMTSKSYEQVMKERWNINTTTECIQ